MLGVDVAKVLRLLKVPKSRALFFPGAFEQAGKWLVPARDVKRFRPGMKVERLYSIAEFAELIGFSYHHIFKQVSAGAISHELVLGEKRIAESEYWRIRRARVA